MSMTDMPSEGTPLRSASEASDNLGSERSRLLRWMDLGPRSQEPWWARYGVLITAIALGGVFSLTTPTFFTGQNFQIIGASNSIAVLVALGALLPLMVGEFDLSVGAVLELSSVLIAVWVGGDHISLALACVLTLLLTTGIGVVNGVLVAFFGISSFIATLATSSVITGVSLYLTSGQILFTGIPQSLTSFSQHFVLGIPHLVVVAVVVTLVLWYLSEQTPLGRQVQAIGLSKDASVLMGVPVRALTVGAFGFAGFMSGVAGVLFLGRVGSASSGIGATFLLPALAAGFLGATTVKTGRFNVLGTAIAVALVAVGLSGLELNGVPSWVEPVFDGIVLLAAIALSRFAALRSGR